MCIYISIFIYFFPCFADDDPYTLAEISTAALFVLSCNHTVFPHKESPTVPVKKETFDFSKGYKNLNINAIAEEVAKRIASLERQQASGGQIAPRPRNHFYIFCSDPDHYLSSCPHAAEYAQKRLCQRNPEGQIVLLNGNRISTRDMPGKNLKERIDNWHKTKVLPQVSSNFVRAAEVKVEYAWSRDAEEDDDQEEMTKKEQEDLQVLENLVASTQKKIDNAKKKFGANKQDKDGLLMRSKAHAANQEKSTQAQPAERLSRPDLQYRYVTPIEDPALIKKLVDQSLDLSITISTCELLSVAPDIRRQVKDQLITKRVVTTATTALQGAIEEIDSPQVLIVNVSEDSLIVAKHTEELRVVDTLIQGIKVIAMVDDSSQIVSIRQDKWEKIGLPIQSDKIMVMESASPETRLWDCFKTSR
jgi:hypothetical protein